MKTTLPYGLYLAVLTSLAVFVAGAETPPNPQPSAPILMDQLGAVAGKQYQGDGLSIAAMPDGARLRCAFQRLEGRVTSEGLWLSSTADGVSDERFRVTAVEVGRVTLCASLDDFGFGEICWINRSAELRFGSFLSPIPDAPIQRSALLPTGLVNVANNVARFIRPGLTEEYSVSVDGVRQDFVIEQGPAGEGELRVELDVTGAKAEPLVNGARLTLNGSGRQLAYTRLHVVDARGRELTARIEVTNPDRLAVVVDDADAVYPVRIDPTFSDANWMSLGGVPGADQFVYATTVDGSGNLYIGGEFAVAGEVIAHAVAKWNGSSWSALGIGMNNRVEALAASGTDVYAGGNFTMATNSGGATVGVSRIAKWNGTSWSAVGGGVNSSVYAVTVSGGDVYVGGFFATATNTGGAAVTVNRLAKWNGSTWSAMSSGLNNIVRAVSVAGTNVYVGGEFTMAGGNPAFRVAKWNGTTWSAMGTGVNGNVNALAVLGIDVYVGGAFTTATNSGGAAVPAMRMAKWNGTSWSALGTGMNASVIALAVSGTDIYAGGIFTAATNSGGAAVTANRIARWNGSSWSALDLGVGARVNALAVSGINLYAGGELKTAGPTSANYIAKWDGSAWSALGSGMNGQVFALAVSGSDLYAGGDFRRAGGSAANYIAKWNGNSWSALGLGMDNIVESLAVSGNDVYAGGWFTWATNSGGAAVLASGIARWNGSSWSAVGLGMNNIVYAMAVSGGDLYAGGNFVRATNNGGVAVTVNGIARWNGSSWSALGSGVNNIVWGLAVSGSDVYAGGDFTMAGGSPAMRIAKWNGIWSALGSLNGGVNDLAVSGSDVYAGGTFTRATNSGGASVLVNRLAKWDGSNWSALGTGLSGTVFDVAVSGSDVYAGGNFLTAGGVTARNIAQWNGTNWSAMGSGMNNIVYALAMSGSDVYAGGDFTVAGGKVAGYVAKANASAATSAGRFSNLVYSPTTGFRFTFLDASVGQPYRIQARSSLASGSWTDFTNFTYTGPIVITNATAGSTNRFYRAVTP